MNIRAKVHGLPLWAWGAIGIVGAAGGYYLSRSFGAAAPAGDDGASDASHTVYLPSPAGPYAGQSGLSDGGLPPFPLADKPPSAILPPVLVGPPVPRAGGGPPAIAPPLIAPPPPHLFGGEGGPLGGCPPGTVWNGYTCAPISHPLHAPPATPPSAPPLPAPPQSGGTYPGLPANFVMDCSLSYRGMLQPDYDSFRANLQHGYPAASVFAWRNAVTAAIQGTPTPWNVAPGDTPIMRANINRKRILFGLYPLTDREFDAMWQDINTLSQGGSERGRDFASDAYARTMFEHWHLPYQCGRHAPSADGRSAARQARAVYGVH